VCDPLQQLLHGSCTSIGNLLQQTGVQTRFAHGIIQVQRRFGQQHGSQFGDQRLHRAHIGRQLLLVGRVRLRRTGSLQLFQVGVATC